MPNPLADKNTCYECGGTPVRYGSLYPLEPVYDSGPGIVNNGAGSAHVSMGPRTIEPPPVKFNCDFNVCSPCYIDQHKRRYPGMDVPVKINYLEKLHALQDQFQEDVELENARAVVSRHEEK